MSLELLRAVIYYSQARGTAYGVAIGLADHYNDEKGAAWPSVARLATFARASERATQDALRILTKPKEQGGLGEWTVELRKNRPSIYRPNFKNFGPRIVPSPRGAESAPTAGPWGADFSEDGPPGVQNFPSRGAESAPNPVKEPDTYGDPVMGAGSAPEPRNAQNAQGENRERWEPKTVDPAKGLEMIRKLREELS